MTSKTIFSLLLVSTFISGYDFGATRTGNTITFDPPVATQAAQSLDSETQFGGLDIWYNSIVKGFNKAMFPGGLPWDYLGETMQEYLGRVDANSIAANKDDTTYLQERVTEMFSSNWTNFIPFTIVMFLGILFVLIFPTFLCCFCCCRCCCGCCGGDGKQADPSRACFIVLVVGTCITLVFTGTATAMMFCSNMRFSQDVPDKTSEFVHGIIDDSSNWVLDTFDSMYSASMNPWNPFVDIFLAELQDAGQGVFGPILTHIDDSLAPETTQVDADIATCNQHAADMETYWNAAYYKLSTARSNMYEVSVNLQTIYDSLNANAACTGDATCAAAAADILNHIINDATFSTYSSGLTTIDTYTQPGALAGFSGAAFLDDINTRANDTLMTEMNTQITDLTNTIRTQTDDIENTINTTSADLRTQIVDNLNNTDITDQVDDAVDRVGTYKSLRIAAGGILIIGPAIAFLLGVLGTIFGLVGFDATVLPSERSSLSNAGGKLLCASAVFSALFIWIYTVCFIFPFAMLSVPMLVCQGLQDDSIITDIVDRPYMVDANNAYPMADLILGNATFELTVTSVIEQCRSGSTLWSAFMMDNSTKYNLAEVFNASNVIGDTSTLLSDTTGFDFSAFDYIFGDLKTDVDEVIGSIGTFQTSLGTLKTGAASTIGTYVWELSNDFTGSTAPETQALQATPCGLTQTECNQLSTIRTNLNTVNSISGVQANIDSLDEIITDLAQLTSDYNDFNTAADAYNTALTALQTSMTAFNTAIGTLKTDLTSTGDQMLIDATTAYADRLLGWVEAYMDHILDAFRTTVGKCDLFTNVWDSIWVYVCDYFVLELTAMYFSSGLIGVALMANTIWCAKLYKYFAKMKSDVKPQKSSRPPQKKYSTRVSPAPPAYTATAAAAAAPPPAPVYYEPAKVSAATHGAPKPSYAWNTARPWEA